MRTIRVTGIGDITIKPDMTRLDISVEGFAVEYGETLRISAEETEQLRDLLTTLGFERNDLKTLSFSVDPEFDHYKEDDVYKKILIGYVYSHSMKIEFPLDNDRLGKIMFALASAVPANPEFRISYFVKDEKTVRNELLGKAVIDAREKAVSLTQAACVELKEIQSIDYSWGKVNFQFQPIHRIGRDDDELLDDDAGYDIDIEPNEKTVSDTVTVIWEIE